MSSKDNSSVVSSAAAAVAPTTRTVPTGGPTAATTRTYAFHWGLRCVVCYTTRREYVSVFGVHQRPTVSLDDPEAAESLFDKPNDDESSSLTRELYQSEARFERKQSRTILVRLRGLNETFKWLLYAMHNETEAVAVSAARAAGLRAALPVAKLPGQRGRGKGNCSGSLRHGFRGRALGRLVDFQTNVFVSTRSGVPFTTRTGARVRREDLSTDELVQRVLAAQCDDSDEEDAKSKKKKLAEAPLTYLVNDELVRLSGLSRRILCAAHPVAQVFWTEMLASGYEPLEAQVPVGDLDLKMGTVIDGIWLHRALQLHVVVELKVRSHVAHLYRQSNARMEEPYDDQPNSLFSQDQLQVGWAMWLARRNGKRADAAAVVVLDPTHIDTAAQYDRARAVSLFRLERWVLEERRVARVMDLLCKQ
jgi:hypothetical protein